MKNLYLTLIVILVLSCSFTGVVSQTHGTFTDKRNGKAYETVKIGNQVWMAENLAYKAKEGCWAYDDDEGYAATYGYLYNFETARNICPAGWHLPTDDEWKTLEQNLGLDEDELNDDNYRGEGIGNKLKSQKGWQLYNGRNYGNNQSGFNALPGGYLTFYDKTYSLEGEYGNWWSATPKGEKYAFGRSLNYNESKVCRFTDDKNYGCSVRCVKDTE